MRVRMGVGMRVGMGMRVGVLVLVVVMMVVLARGRGLSRRHAESIDEGRRTGDTESAGNQPL